MQTMSNGADFEAPHPNGAAEHAPRARTGRAPWELMILLLFVALIAVGIILGWTLLGSHSPERMDVKSAVALNAVCNTAQSQLAALPDSFPRTGAERVARIRAENAVMRSMVSDLNQVNPLKPTPAHALEGWTADWSRVLDARDRYADDLAATANTNKKAQFVLPATTGIKPVTAKMDDFVRENHPNLDGCFTEALALDVVEGPREYKKVTE
jgi:hypothetical protein